MSTENPRLFEPVLIGTTQIRNRIWVSPMCQYAATSRDGMPTDWHLVHLGSFALGGVGLIVTESTAVSPEGRISDFDTGLWADEQVDGWRPVVAFVHAQGAKIAVQLAHAGRKASSRVPWDPKQGSVPLDEGGWATVAPSAMTIPGFALPMSLDSAGIAKVISDFRSAAERAVRAGFDAIELHAAHGYLLHQFLSPLSNNRTDSYGGPLENRARLLLQVVRSIREGAGSLPVLIRISATDWTDGGFTVDEATTLAAWAGEAGADFIDVSSGGLIRGIHYPAAPGYQVELAEHVAQSGMPVSAVGRIVDPDHAELILAGGLVQAVMLGREFLRNPHWALTAARHLEHDLPYWPDRYFRAK